jgi:MerR family transcriptional regulator, thiopeptide resistance regulator
MNVGEVAALAGVTVRTLHHYDRIGLLSPSGRTAAGYRQYAPGDLDRLHQVLLYRELGFPLEEVATLLDDPSADP